MNGKICDIFRKSNIIDIITQICSAHFKKSKAIENTWKAQEIMQNIKVQKQDKQINQ